MKSTIAVLSGDGIGPEVIEQSLKSLKAIEVGFGHQFELNHGLIGAVAIDATGNPFPEEILNSVMMLRANQNPPSCSIILG